MGPLLLGGSQIVGEVHLSKTLSTINMYLPLEHVKKNSRVKRLIITAGHTLTKITDRFFFRWKQLPWLSHTTSGLRRFCLYPPPKDLPGEFINVGYPQALMSKML